jgi:hypothetical protein
MKNRRLFMTLFLLTTSVGISAAWSAQNGSSGATKSNEPLAKHELAIGFLRTLNTAEVTDFQSYGLYASWEALLAHQPKYLNEWLATYHPQGPNVHFGTPAEILPGWSLRLVVHGCTRRWTRLRCEAARFERQGVLVRRHHG